MDQQLCANCGKPVQRGPFEIPRHIELGLVFCNVMDNHDKRTARMPAEGPTPTTDMETIVKNPKSLVKQLPAFVRGHGFKTIAPDMDHAETDNDYDGSHEATEDISEAHVVISADLETGMHRPVLDVDFPARLIPSSTPGHFHLYLDKPMEWDSYERLLRALGRAGIIEPGYASASIERQYTSVRLPWIRKWKPAPEETK